MTAEQAGQHRANQVETEQAGLLRIHHSTEEQYPLAKGAWEKILLPKKQKERKFQEVSWQFGSITLTSTARGICWLKRCTISVDNDYSMVN